MRNLLLAAFILLGLSANAQERIKLNQPNKDRGVSIMKALEARQSTNEFANQELSQEDLSDLLWAAAGINRPEIGKKTAPSAQNAQEIDVYVCLKGGAYVYNAREHALILVTEKDLRMMGERREGAVAAPCLLLLVAETSRYQVSAYNTKEHVDNMSKVDVGIVSQNISLFCAGVGIGTKPRAQMDHAGLKDALRLNDTQILILNHPVGYKK